MKNKIHPFIGPRKKVIPLELLSGMDADIVAKDGSLPDVHIKFIGNLRHGGEVGLYSEGSEDCWLETDDKAVVYYPPGGFGGADGCIYYSEKNPNPSKHARKQYGLHFYINLAGQRARSPPISG